MSKGSHFAKLRQKALVCVPWKSSLEQIDHPKAFAQPWTGTKFGLYSAMPALEHVGLKSKSGIQILVVEDEPIISMLIEDMLMEIGCKNVEIVASISSALDFLEHVRPDFAILDIDLNGIRSYPVAAVLKSRQIPFVFVSGYDAATLDSAYTDIQILQKPFRIGDLNSTIEAALASA